MTTRAMPGQQDSWVEDPYARSEALKRVIAVINEKGGVGKTSITANLAGQAATAGYRVLVVDINRQGNIALDLGYRGEPDVDDDGQGLMAAIMMGQPLRPAEGVRSNLSVIAGGTKLEGLTPLMITRMTQERDVAFLALGKALAPVAREYDLVFIDCPPENPILDDLALGAARWVLIPTKSDDGGLAGMRLVAERFLKAREINPVIQLLGVVLFGTGTKATAIHAEVREAVSEIFGGNSPLFEATIRHSERIARDSRKGRLVHELEEAANQQPEWWKLLREGKKVPRIASTVTGVSADYQALAVEVLQTLRNAEEAAALAEAQS